MCFISYEYLPEAESSEFKKVEVFSQLFYFKMTHESIDCACHALFLIQLIWVRHLLLESSHVITGCGAGGFSEQRLHFGLHPKNPVAHFVFHQFLPLG